MVIFKNLSFYFVSSLVKIGFDRIGQVFKFLSLLLDLQVQCLDLQVFVFILLLKLLQGLNHLVLHLNSFITLCELHLKPLNLISLITTLRNVPQSMPVVKFYLTFVHRTNEPQLFNHVLMMPRKLSFKPLCTPALRTGLLINL